MDNWHEEFTFWNKTLYPYLEKVKNATGETYEITIKTPRKFNLLNLPYAELQGNFGHPITAHSINDLTILIVFDLKIHIPTHIPEPPNHHKID